MRLNNPSSHAQVLVGASSPACGVMMLHRSETTGGTDAMIEVKQVTIPARGSLSFNPGNFHLMCMQPKMGIGQKVKVVLTLKSGQTFTAPFTVFGASGKPSRTRPSTP
jgi:copper(I)-binding protein